MAYISATPRQKDPPGPDGRVRIVVEFAGDAGEPLIRREKYLDNEALADIQAWARAEVAALQGKRTSAGAIVVGTPISLVPPAPVVPTAAEIAEKAWLEKANRLRRAKALGLTNATAVANIATLEADVNATYLPAYILKV